MKPIQLSRVRLTSTIAAAGMSDASYAHDTPAGLRLWYLGPIVLVERPGHADTAIPLSAVVSMEADGSRSASEWATGTEEIPGAPKPKAAPVAPRPAVTPSTPAAPQRPNRGPGRPKGSRNKPKA